MPAVGRQHVAWAFICGVGAAFIAAAVVEFVMRLLGFILFPPTQERPEWLTPSVISGTLASVAAGFVLTRAGGLPAVAAYVVYELVLTAAALPGRLLFCSRAGDLSQFPLRGCDYPALLVQHWPVWSGLVLGLLIARARTSTLTREDWTLRGAGVFGFVTQAAASALALIIVSDASVDQQFTYVNLYTAVTAVAGVGAGMVLARASLAATAVMIAAIVVPPLFAVPLALTPGPASEPPEFAIMRWSSIGAPLLAAFGVVLARGYIRRRRGGTFF